MTGSRDRLELERIIDRAVALRMPINALSREFVEAWSDYKAYSKAQGDVIEAQEKLLVAYRLGNSRLAGSAIDKLEAAKAALASLTTHKEQGHAE